MCIAPKAFIAAMALSPKTQNALTDESKGVPYHEIIRDYEPAPGVNWRLGKPDYTKVNKAYFQHRAKRHPEGSLEAIVSKLVKNWEVEAHHIADIHQWKTMDINKFRAALNGGCPYSAQLMSDVGPYNMLIGETAAYSAANNTFESANTIFTQTFSEGYAWEVLEVLSGPPTVTFKWRHFGKFSGVYTDKCGRKHKGNGQILNLIGLCIAKVNDQLLIESLDVYYNPQDLLTPLMTKTTVSDEVAPVGCDEADRQGAQDAACCSAKAEAAHQACSLM